MTSRGWILMATVAAVGVFAAASAAQPTRAPVAHRAAPVEPVVVELFTAQGCAGCPQANARVEAVAEAPGVIVLTYGVDYWDYLGWTDTFARPEFTERQQAYRQALRLRSVSTPQVVIDGRRQVSGARADELSAAIDEEAARRLFPPQIEFRETGKSVGIGSGRVPTGGADVVAVVYRPGPQTVVIEDGDNRGQRVRQVNVVRQVQTLGDWRGSPLLLDLPTDVQAGEAVVVMVQSRADRRILSAAAS